MARFDPNVAKALEGLSIQKRRFVVAYCTKARGNQFLAAKLAGVKGDERTQKAVASQLLRMPIVRKAINAWMEAYAMTAVELTARMRDMAEINPGPFVEWCEDGTLNIKVPTAEDWEAHKHWIKTIKADGLTGKVVEFRLHSRLDAMKEMAKILKLYSDVPIFVLNAQLSSASDAELLKLWQDAKGDDGSKPLLPKATVERIAAGEEVAEVVETEEDEDALDEFEEGDDRPGKEW